MAHRTCCRCGTAFEPRNGNQRYCMKRCQKAGERERYRAKRVPMRCDHCGEEFMGRRWEKNDEHKRRYCSDECHHEAKRLRFGERCEHGHVGRSSCPQCAAEVAGRRAQRQERMTARAIMLGDPCAYCGSRVEAGIDHIVPREADGVDDWANWTACCRRCNGQKGTLPLLGFLLWQQLRPLELEVRGRMNAIHSLRADHPLGGGGDPRSPLD